MILKTLTLYALLCALPARLAWAQKAESPPALPHPKIHVNFLNTCRPAQADLEEMGRALSLVTEMPVFSADFEISRGLTTMNEGEARAAGAYAGSEGIPSIWVRIRKEFPEKAVLSNAQYSLSVEGKSISEVLALHLREGSAGEGKDVLQILISDSATGSPAQVARVETLPDRIRIERFGKASIVLARCGGMDQSGYEPLFLAAGGIFQNYKVAMAVKSVVPAELSHWPGLKESKAASANH
jgi:hypothetical protein